MHGKDGWCFVKVLVLSDSHSGLHFMRYCVDKVKPDHIIHLGDFYSDGEAIQELYSHIRMHQVPGNGDTSRREPWIVDVLCYDIGGVRFFMTHGHNHGVKSDGCTRLIEAASAASAQVALFGHTHDALCFRTEDGLWVMNPGSCRSYSGSVGLIRIEDKKITSCRVLRQEDLENL